MSGRTSYNGSRSLPPRAAAPARTPKRPADVIVAEVNSPKPPGKGWVLEDYTRDEHTGIARFVYQRYAWDAESATIRPVAKTRTIIEQPRPSTSYQEGWAQKPEIDRNAAFARCFEARLVNDAMYAAGAYGR